MSNPQTFVVVFTNSRGEQETWECVAESAVKAFMAFNELLPGQEITAVTPKGDW